MWGSMDNILDRSPDSQSASISTWNPDKQHLVAHRFAINRTREQCDHVEPFFALPVSLAAIFTPLEAVAKQGPSCIMIIYLK